MYIVNEYDINITYIVQICVFIAFIVLLIMAIILLGDFYISDGKKSKSYREAAKKGSFGSKEFTNELINTLFADGTWPISYIGATISTAFLLLCAGIPITIKNYAIVFLITFFTFYSIFLFVLHHYVFFIKKDISDYIINSTPVK